MANRNSGNYESTMKLRAILFIVVFLLMIAVIFSLLNGMGFSFKNPDEKKEEEVIKPAPQPVEATPEPTIYVVEPPVENNLPIESAPEPSLNPNIYVVDPPPEENGNYETGSEPSPEYSGSAVSYGEIIGSGTMASNTGVPINLRVDWTAVSISATEVRVTVTVKLEHYQLNTGSRNVTVSLAGNSESFYGPEIQYNDGGFRSTEMGSRSFVINLAPGETASPVLYAGWSYNGSYSGTQLNVIEVNGNINISR